MNPINPIAAFLEKICHPQEARVLRYLMNYARGSVNARSWRQIKDATETTLTKNQFQQGLLKRLRETPGCFIGSCDQLPKPGYFILMSMDDVKIAQHWYEQRIAVEQCRLVCLMETAQMLFPKAMQEELGD